jgi:hypothetical protein
LLAFFQREIGVGGAKRDELGDGFGGGENVQIFWQEDF